MKIINFINNLPPTQSTPYHHGAGIRRNHLNQILHGKYKSTIKFPTIEEGYQDNREIKSLKSRKTHKKTRKVKIK
jgi:hypothetical protein